MLVAYLLINSNLPCPYEKEIGLEHVYSSIFQSIMNLLVKLYSLTQNEFFFTLNRINLELLGYMLPIFV